MEAIEIIDDEGDSTQNEEMVSSIHEMFPDLPKSKIRHTITRYQNPFPNPSQPPSTEEKTGRDGGHLSQRIADRR